jgi:CheY-like chemotaxis protein
MLMSTDSSEAGGACAVAEPPAPAADSDVRTILLVDGARLFLKLEETLLRRDGWTIHGAQSAEEARHVLRREPVDLVLMDYVLPDATGDELVRFIRGNEPTRSTGIVIVTARGMREHIDRCMAAGCNAFLFKPVTKAVLCDKVKELLNVPARRHVRTLVRLEVNASTRDRYFFGNTVNLSAGGLLLETPLDLALGESINLRFFLPGDSEPVTASARVVRRVPGEGTASHSYGLEFDQLADGDRARLGSFVDEGATWTAASTA